MIIALVVNSKFKGRGVMRAVMLVPWAIPTVVAAQMWKWMLDDVFGVVNDLGVRLHLLAHARAWISDPSTALGSVAAVDIWKTTPFVALLLLAGLQVIPNDLYEAAEVDGANKLEQFWKITLPLLRPAILVTLIFRTLDALRVFDVFYVFFGNRPDTQTMAIYDQSTIVGDGHVGYGAAISVAIFLIIAIFVVIYVSLTRGAESNDHRRRTTRRDRAAGQPEPQAAEEPLRADPLQEPVLPPDRRHPRLLPVPVLLGDSLLFHARGRPLLAPDPVLPLAPDLGQLPRSVRAASFFTDALLNSAIVAGSVTLLSLAIGSFAAFALGRFRFHGRSFVMYLMLSMTIFPQIAILGALYTTISTLHLHLYDKLGALIFTYLIFTLPFTIWVLTSFMRALPGDLEEAAYVDGATPLQVFWKVLLPLIAPGLVTTGLLAFISAWNEYLYALSFIQTPSNYTVPLAITSFVSKTGSAFAVPWGQIMAATVIVTLPLIAAVLILQRRIIAGLTAGAVKGKIASRVSGSKK